MFGPLSGSSAAISRSASSVVIFPAASISKIRRRFSFIPILLTHESQTLSGAGFAAGCARISTSAPAPLQINPITPITCRTTGSPPSTTIRATCAIRGPSHCNCAATAITAHAAIAHAASRSALAATISRSACAASIRPAASNCKIIFFIALASTESSPGSSSLRPSHARRYRANCIGGPRRYAVRQRNSPATGHTPPAAPRAQAESAVKAGAPGSRAETAEPTTGSCAAARESAHAQWRYSASFQCLQFADRILGADLARLQPLQHVSARGRRVGVDKFKLPGDAVQPGLDGGIADAEDLLHLLDGAMRAQKSGHKHLVFEGEPRQLRQGKLAFQGDSFFGNTDPLNDHGAALCDAQQVLPVRGGFWGRGHGSSS